MICGLYIIVPFLKRISEDPYLERYFLFFGFIFAFIIPQTTDIIRLFVPALADILSSISRNINMHFVLGYSVYYVLGSYLYKNHHKLIKYSKIIYFRRHRFFPDCNNEYHCLQTNRKSRNLIL